MGNTYLDAAADGFDRDEATDFGLFDRGCTGHPNQGSKFDRLAERKHIDDVADRCG